MYSSIASRERFRYHSPSVQRRGVQALGGLMVLAIAGVTISALFGEHGTAHLLRLRAERRALTDNAFALMQRNTQLRSDIAHLRGDDRHLEGFARRQLGLVRPNETVYRFRRHTDGAR